MTKRGRTVVESKTSTPFSLAIAGILKTGGSIATVRKAVAAAYAMHADSISGASLDDVMAFVSSVVSSGAARVARGAELVKVKSRGNPFTLAVLAAITKGGGRTSTDAACIAAAALATPLLSQKELADLKAYVSRTAHTVGRHLEFANARGAFDQVFFSNGDPNVDFAATLGNAKTYCNVDTMTILRLPSTVTNAFTSTKKKIGLRASTPIPGINTCSHGASGYLISNKVLKAAPHNFRITKWRHIDAPPATTTNLAAYKDTFDWIDISCDCGNSDFDDMVQCSTCKKWFHFHCAGVTTLEGQEEWTCPLHSGTEGQAEGEAAAPAPALARPQARVQAPVPARESRPPRASAVQGDRARQAQQARDAADEDEE
jgi:hypothetical protein